MRLLLTAFQAKWSLIDDWLLFFTGIRSDGRGFYWFSEGLADSRIASNPLIIITCLGPSRDLLAIFVNVPYVYISTCWKGRVHRIPSKQIFILRLSQYCAHFGPPFWASPKWPMEMFQCRWQLMVKKTVNSCQLTTPNWNSSENCFKCFCFFGIFLLFCSTWNLPLKSHSSSTCSVAFVGFSGVYDGPLATIPSVFFGCFHLAAMMGFFPATGWEGALRICPWHW